jgi:hypothetical protein
MSTFILVVRELIGLFIDDGSLAIAIAAVVALALGVAAVGGPAVVTGSVLFLGPLIVLLENISRTVRKN